MTSKVSDRRTHWAAVWGILGVLALLGRALWRLTPIAVEPLRSGQMSGLQAAIYAAWVVFNAYFEGYRAFQLRFSPRVVQRALHLADNPRRAHVLLAPIFCMGFFHATRKTRALAWGTALMVIGFITLLRYVPQPWRGIVDGGVVVALLWGSLAIVYYFVRGLLGHSVPGSAELPLTAQPAD